MAVIAASTPLLPNIPRDRSIACCWVLSVRPKITGLLYFRETSFIPNAVDWQTKSKYFVSPCITLPKHITASMVVSFSKIN